MFLAFSVTLAISIGPIVLAHYCTVYTVASIASNGLLEVSTGPIHRPLHVYWAVDVTLQIGLGVVVLISCDISWLCGRSRLACCRW